MEDLIREIQEKTGLSADKVLEVVTMVTDYMKNALPEELVAQVASYLGDAASNPQGAVTTAASAASEFATQAADTAVTAVGAVLSAVSDVLPKPDDG
ncbi:MAG: hypothetical protein ACC683_07195 [Acidimicrobiia bacterium]